MSQAPSATTQLYDRSKRVSTGCAGLDDVLGGGFVKGEFYLIEGEPGTGKTTFAMQFLLEGVRTGEKVLYVTFSESRKALLKLAESHDFSLENVEIFEVMPRQDELRPDSQYNVFRPADVELTNRMESVLSAIERVNPDRLVIDALSELRMLAGEPLQFRRQIFSMKEFLNDRDCTVLAVDERSDGHESPVLHALAHGVIVFDKLARDYGSSRRRLEVPKVRGSKYREGFHDYVIVKGGLVVFPRLVAAESRDEGISPDFLSSGITELDELAGGGLRRGTNTLIMGPAGSGKTTLSMLWAVAAARRGEHASMFLFEEGLTTLLSRAAALGIDIRPHLDAGTILINRVDPAELSPGEFVHEVRRAVEEQSARVVVIDSLNGYLQAMPGEQYLTLHLHELLSYLNHHRVVALAILNQVGMIGAGMQTPVDISYLADNILVLRYFEAQGRIRKALSMIKKRGSYHEDTIRELNFEGGRIRVGKALTNFQGVLTGVPQFLGKQGFESGEEAA